MKSTNQILLYLPKESARLRYGIEILFKHLLGLTPIIVKEIHTDIDPTLPIISLQENSDLQRPYIRLHSWIFQSHIDTSFTPEHTTFENSITLFSHSDTHSLLPFDIFSATIYLLSRYEEYGLLPKDKDAWGRFPAKQCLLHKLGVLQKPVVNLWSLKLKEILEKQFPKLIFTLPKYQCLPTVDVDQVYAFKYKPIHIQMGAFAKDIFNTILHPSQKNMLPYRWEYYTKQISDPFNNILWWTNFFTKNKLSAHFFILMGNYGGVDKSNPSQINEFQQTLQTLNTFENISVGIHFSEKSNRQTQLQKIEIEDLQKINPKPIDSNRQHFLILNFPQTYQDLLKHGLKKDFSMGYADLVGFRAGIATPYPYFDLEKNQRTELTIFPFAFMDGTYRKYMQCDYTDTLSSMKKLVDEVRAVGGTFSCLFHNESLTDTPPWENWKELYINLINYAKS